MNKLSAINKIKIDESIIVINLVKNVTNYWCLMARVELLTPTLNRTEQIKMEDTNQHVSP